MRAHLSSAAALVVGVVLGAVVTIGVQGSTLEPNGSNRGAQEGAGRLPATTTERPRTFLAWVPGGLPSGFGERVRELPGVGRVTIVAEDNTWMTRSWSAGGGIVDRPRRSFMIPIDAASVDLRTFAPFLPPADRAVVTGLANGEGILGATSAALRGLTPGATLQFDGGVRVRVAAVLPDELVGAAELLVSRATGALIGVRQERYLLLRPSTGAPAPTSERLARTLRPVLPADLSYRRVQVRAPGETPYFRQGDAVLPPVLIKTLFGEFAARPEPGRPGYLDVDPAWERRQIVTTKVPVLGEVTCNRALIPQLRGAMAALRRMGLAHLIETYHGCYAPKFINRVPTAMISHHAWGIGFDVNLAGNLFGIVPDQDPRLVRLMERWGFIWGGTFLVPDGNHFEYRRPASAQR